MHPIIDSHLDLAWNATGWRRDLLQRTPEINRREAALTDDLARGNATTALPEMREGNIAVCLATVLSRCSSYNRPGTRNLVLAGELSLDYPTHDIAFAVGQGQVAYYRGLEYEGHVRMIRTAQQLDDHWESWQGESGPQPLGIILAMEGCDPIIDPGHAEHWWQDGLRCASLVHYGRSAYAVGTGDDGPLTPAGVELLKEFERLGMILDVTHLSDTSYYQALETFNGPVMASHNNCRALVPGDRQFSDDQIRLLIERDGVIGAALDCWMLYPGWSRGKTPRDVVSLEAVADHMEHICQLAGNCRHIAVGTDLDGGFGTEQAPVGLDTIADLQKLDGILAARGFANEDIAAIFHGNWLRFFRQHLE